MSETSLETKMEILGNIWLFYSEEAKSHEGWSDFFEWADVALPMSYLAWMKLVDVKPESEHYVHEAWIELCQMIDVDADEEYQNLKELFAASPNDGVGTDSDDDE